MDLWVRPLWFLALQKGYLRKQLATCTLDRRYSNVTLITHYVYQIDSVYSQLYCTPGL